MYSFDGWPELVDAYGVESGSRVDVALLTAIVNKRSLSVATIFKYFLS